MTRYEIRQDESRNSQKSMNACRMFRSPQEGTNFLRGGTWGCRKIYGECSISLAKLSFGAVTRVDQKTTYEMRVQSPMGSGSFGGVFSLYDS